MANSKNDFHFMVIITRSVKYLDVNMVEIYKQESAKKKQFDILCVISLKSQEVDDDEPMIVDKNVDEEETPKVINSELDKEDDS